jgi:hypothetical protein
MFKKTVVLSCLMINSFICTRPIVKPIKRDAVSTYAEHYIYTLFDAHMDQPYEIREFLNNLKKQITEDSIANCKEYAYVFFPQGTFKCSCVEEVIRTKVLDYLVDQAAQITRTYPTDPATIEHITNTVRAEICTIFSNKANLNGSLKRFKGDELKKHVWSLKEQFDKERRQQAQAQAEITEQQQSPIKTYYSSDECCACFESFGDVRRVYLNPCGHDMCTNCANLVVKCPQCRAHIIDRRAY